jgi:hypothetical protein
MDVQDFWISKGRLEAWPGGDVTSLAYERRLLAREGFVKISVGPLGTRVKWDSNAPNWASLFFAKEWLGTFAGPYRLSYFLYGWFEEQFEDQAEAAQRIDHLIAKSDIRLRSPVLVQGFSQIRASAPELLQRVYSDNRAEASESIDCDFDERSRQFKVTRIGEASAIATYWGPSPVTYPCRNGGTYDRVVSNVYARVVETGRPHYDQVCAAMPRPDGEIGWITYHRVVVPKQAFASPGVSVVSVFKPVEITVV